MRRERPYSAVMSSEDVRTGIGVAAAVAVVVFVLLFMHFSVFEIVGAAVALAVCAPIVIRNRQREAARRAQRWQAPDPGARIG